MSGPAGTSRTGVLRLAFLPVFGAAGTLFGGGVLASLALAAIPRLQQPAAIRVASPGAARIMVSAQCTTVGSGADGRRDGLLGIAGGSVTSDGSIVLLNGSTSEILRFSRDGRLRDEVSRAGQGPGEFAPARPGVVSSARMVPYRGDSVVVFDAATRRVSIFDQTGKFGRSSRIDSLADLVAHSVIIGAATDGDFLLVTRFRSPSSSSDLTPGVKYSRTPLVVLRVSASGKVRWSTDTLSGFKTEMRIIAAGVTVTSDGRRRYSVSSGISETMPTERNYAIAASNEHVYHYDEATNELHSYNLQGRLDTRLLLPTLPVPRPLSSSRPSGKQRLSIASDAMGRVWLQIPRSDGGQELHWWVISREGQIAATAVTPPGTGLLWIGTDRIALRAFDADGVETVRVCALTRS